MIKLKLFEFRFCFVVTLSTYRIDEIIFIYRGSNTDTVETVIMQKTAIEICASKLYINIQYSTVINNPKIKTKER